MPKFSTYLKAYHPIVQFLLLGTVLISLTNAMSIVYLPIYLIATSHLDPVTVGFITGSGAIMATFGGFIGGTLSDFFGRKRFMLLSLLVLGAVFTGLVMTTEPIYILILNSLRGIFSSFFMTISKALMADLTPKENRFRVFSNRYVAGNIGYAAGPIIGTFFGIAGNSTAFLLTAFIYFVYFIIIAALFRSTIIHEEVQEKVSFKQSWNVFITDKVLILFIMGSILLTAVHGEMSVTLSQYLKSNITGGIRLFGYLMSINSITVILMQMFITRWAEKYGLLTRIALGSILFAAGEVGFGFSSGWWGFILSMFIFTLGEILIIPSEYAQIDEITPQGMRGMYYGAQSFTEMGNFFGPWLGGFLLITFGGRTMFLTFAFIALISILFYAWGRQIHFKKTSGGLLQKNSTAVEHP